MKNYAMVKNNDNQPDIISVLSKIDNNQSEMSKVIYGIANSFGTISQDVEKLKSSANHTEERLTQLELNEEITTYQQETIIDMARKRIVDILGSDPLERQKYFRIFSQRLYSDTRRNAGLGSKISRTRKADFQRCIDYIEAWYPICGVANLKTKADINAEARRTAREMGYD